jgi:glucokinase
MNIINLAPYLSKKHKTLVGLSADDCRTDFQDKILKMLEEVINLSDDNNVQENIKSYLGDTHCKLVQFAHHLACVSIVGPLTNDDFEDGEAEWGFTAGDIEYKLITKKIKKENTDNEPTI